MGLPKFQTDEELLRWANYQRDPLTSSEVEIALIDNLEARIKWMDDYKPIIDVIDEFEISAADLKALCDSMIQDFVTSAKLLGAVGHAGIDDPESLKEHLELSRSFSDIADDAYDVLTRLTQLTTTVKE